MYNLYFPCGLCKDKIFLWLDIRKVNILSKWDMMSDCCYKFLTPVCQNWFFANYTWIQTDIIAYLCTNPRPFDALAALLSSPDSQEPAHALLTSQVSSYESAYVCWNALRLWDGGTVHSTSGSLTAWAQPPSNVSSLIINKAKEQLPVWCACN